MSGKKETVRQKDKRSGDVVTKQVTVRMRGQDGLTEMEYDERSGGSVWVMSKAGH